MEKYSFFNDIDNDRVYFAEDFARHLKKYFTNGIFNNELKVIANNDMTVTIQPGDANIEGYRYTNTDNLIKNIENADGTLKRIDNVVVRLDLTNRMISSQIIKGDFSSNPTAPALQRTSTVYDIKLAEISILPGATSIEQENIKDTRFDTDMCGNVISSVQTPDTTDIFAQYESAFLNWFNNVKGILSEDVAGNLLSKIEANEKKISDSDDRIDNVDNKVNEQEEKITNNEEKEWEVIEISDSDLSSWRMEE